MIANLKLFYVYTVSDGAIYTIALQGGLYVATTPKGLVFGTSISEVKSEIEKVTSHPEYKYVGKSIRDF